MPQRPRLSTGGLAYHVLNRRVGRLPLFETPTDYTALKKFFMKPTGEPVSASLHTV